jgi:glycosyltransferase involved in cell wall biosynthesis
LRVHHIINDISLEKGGAQHLVSQLHRGLRERGMESRIVALCDSTADTIDAFSLNNISPYNFKAFISTFQYIRKHCLSEDIIHVHLFPSIFYVSLAVRLLRWPGLLVCTEHNTSNRRRKHPMGKLIDRLTYSMYQKIYCISKGTMNALQSWMPSQSGKLKVVENGIKLQYKQFFKKNKKETIVIASVGRLHKQKNYEVAIRAIAMLKNIAIEYRIAGTGSEAASLKALCNQLDLNNKIKFYGYVDDIFIFLNQADIFLMPSSWEGFGLAVVEAMNSGLPIIASNVEGIKEILNTLDPCCILTSPDDPNEIAVAVKTLLDENKRETYGKNAFSRSFAFSKERMIEGYINEYSQLSFPS